MKWLFDPSNPQLAVSVWIDDPDIRPWGQNFVPTNWKAISTLQNPLTLCRSLGFSLHGRVPRHWTLTGCALSRVHRFYRQCDAITSRVEKWTCESCLYARWARGGCDGTEQGCEASTFHPGVSTEICRTNLYASQVWWRCQYPGTRMDWLHFIWHSKAGVRNLNATFYRMVSILVPMTTWIELHSVEYKHCFL